MDTGMALNVNFNLGQGTGSWGSGCPSCGGHSNLGGNGLVGVSQGSLNPMGLMGQQMMAMLTMNMAMMMNQLMQMLGGGNALSAGLGQFGGSTQGGSPLDGFLGGATSGGSSGGSASSAGPVGNGASLGPADGSTSPKTKKFIDLALSKQGTPYVFGAAGPNKFDCSGLVSWALKEAGVSGGRATAAGLQDRYKGSSISRKEDLKPGDLVFFWSPNDRGIPRGKASHVEIYLGNGKTMGTDSPKEGARVEPINWSTFIGGARVPQLQN